MYKIIQIALILVKQFVRQPITLISMVLVPLLFTFAVGQATHIGGDDEPSWELAVANHDAGTLGEHLVEYLATDPDLDVKRVKPPNGPSAIATVWKTVHNNFNEALAVAADRLNLNRAADIGFLALQKEQPKGTSVPAMARLIIPQDFSSRLRAGRDVVLQFEPRGYANDEAELLEQTIQNDLRQFIRSLQITQVIQEVFADLELSTDSHSLAQLAYTESLYEEIGKAEAERNLRPVHELSFNGINPAGKFNQSSVGMLVMFAMLTFLASAGITLVSEREEGTLSRFLVMPVRKSSILLGKMLGIFMVGTTQIVILVLAGIVLFKVNWNQSPVALLVVMVSFSLACTGMGMLMATMTRTAMQASVFTNVVVMSMCALGGAWWPLEVEPLWMQTLATAFPVTWAMQGLHDVASNRMGVTGILPEAGMLIGFAILFFGIGLWKFRYE